MADLRIPPPSIPPARPAAPARTEAVRTAQQAFFHAALGRPAAPPRAPAPAATPAAAPTTEAAPQKLLRPGSFVDIKV